MTLSLPVEVEVCPVCASAICRRITSVAHDRWKAESALRARTFANPERFGVHTTDPGTVCQTTRRPHPSNPSAGQQGKRGRANRSGSNAPDGE